MHRHILILLASLSFCIFLSHAKISQHIAQHFQTSQNNEIVNIWIYFANKTETQPVLLSEKSYARRLKHGLDPFHHVDIPVSEIYLSEVKNFVGEANIRSTSRWLNAVSASCTFSQIQQLAKLPFVTNIQPLLTMIKPIPTSNYHQDNTMSISPSHFKQTKSQKSPHPLYGYSIEGISMHSLQPLLDAGLNGEGVSVLVIDSGFWLSHEAFSSLKVVSQYDFVYNDTTVSNEPQDIVRQQEHGTNVLSMIGGYKPGVIWGSAWKADYLLAKTEIVDEEVRVEEDNFIRALEWGETLGCDIATASLGYYKWYSFSDMDGSTPATSDAVNIATELGIFVVVSVGNLGADGISPPADAFWCMSVGAVDKDGIIGDFSSIGPTYDGRLKPEVVGFGVEAYVAAPGLKSNYTRASGTSLSAPLVAGIAALLLQGHPEWTNLQLRQALMVTSSKATRPNLEYGMGIVNALDAYQFDPPAVCPNNCSLHGQCQSGACVCDEGYYDYDCSFIKIKCSQYCQHGSCNNINVCICDSGYSGVDCSKKEASNSEDSKLLEVVITMVFGVLFIVALVLIAYKYRHTEAVSYLRVTLFVMLAIGIPLLDIAISLGVVKDVYDITIKLTWIAVEFIWKLVTAVLVYPFAGSGLLLAAFGTAGSMLHICWTFPVGYLAYSNVQISDDRYKAAETVQVLGNVILDFVILPYLFMYLMAQKQKSTAEISPDEPSAPDMLMMRSIKLPKLDDAQQTKEEPAPRVDTQIDLVNHFCIVAYILFQIADILVLRQTENQTKIPFATILLLLFVPIGIQFWLDRTKRFNRSFRYFYNYLFLVGSFALVPIRVVTELYVTIQGIPSANLLLLVAQSAFMQTVTNLTKKAAKNMTSGTDYTPFVFRYQFFEEFLALILFMRREINEILFWVFLVFQVGWTITRNAGLLMKGTRIVIRFFKKLILGTVEEQVFVENTRREELLSTLRTAHQYLICDFVSIIAIPAQFYTVTAFAPFYPAVVGVNETMVIIIYFVVGLLRAVVHSLVYLILSTQIANFNEGASQSMPTYTEEFWRTLKTMGHYFTIMSFVSTRDAYIAARAIFTR